MLLYFLQYLSCEHYNGGCAIADFRILGTSYVGQDSGCGVDYVEELHENLASGREGFERGTHLHNGGTIVGDCLTAIFIN